MPVPNSNVDQLTAITNDFFMDDVKDLVHNQNVLWQMLSKNERLISGGAKIDQPILYQFTQDGPYYDFEKASTAAEDQVTRAEFNWKLYRQRVVISEPEMDRASGPESVFDLLEAKTKGAGMAIRDSLGTGVFTAAGNDTTRQINSLENLLGDGTVPSGNTTAGGINKATATNAFWRGITEDYAAATLGVLADMLDLWFAIVDGNIKPNLIISHTTPLKIHQQEVSGIVGSLTRTETFSNTNAMTSGFATYTFQGVPWITDLHCPTDRLFMLNTDFLHLAVHRKRNFQLKPFVQPVDQDVNIAFIKWMGNITVSDPSRSGYMFT